MYLYQGKLYYLKHIFLDLSFKKFNIVWLKSIGNKHVLNIIKYMNLK